jgi:arsenate reductase
MSQGPDKLKILFLCTGNSCRSQMAEGWAKKLLEQKVEAWSAGVATHGLNEWAVRVMDEAGVDISNNQSKLVEDLLEIDFDNVITVCDHARESCPVFPGKAVLVHRSFDDPPRLAKSARTDEETLAVYRRVRDEIRVFVVNLPEFLQSQ